MSHAEQVKSTKYRNWVKAGLGLKYLGNGLAPFVDNAVKVQHDAILQDIDKNHGANTRCGHCKLATLMPIHTIDRNNKCPLGHRPNCNCRSPRGKVLCGSRLCSAFYDKLIIQHRYFSPNWKNTDITHWFDNHWQIAKTCIPAGGYEKHTSVRETDCAGLLNIIINNSTIHSLLDTVIDAPNDIFSKTRKARDDIFHSSTFELDDAELDTVLDNMIAILEDKTQIKDMPEAADARNNIAQLRGQNFVITMYDEAEIRKNAMDALDEMMQNALDLINEKQRQVLEEIQSCGLQQRTTTDAIENRLDSTEKTVQSLQDRQTEVETSVANLRGSHLQLIEDVRKINQELEKIKSDELYSKAKAKHDEVLKHIEDKKAPESDCKDILKDTPTAPSGIYKISLWMTKKMLTVFCDMETDGGGWTVIQNRFDRNADFNRTFDDYENGFGAVHGEFWLGLKHTQEMSEHDATEIRLEATSKSNEFYSETYTDFKLLNGPDYRLSVNVDSDWTGGNGFAGTNGFPFSTSDKDRDSLKSRLKFRWFYPDNRS